MFIDHNMLDIWMVDMNGIIVTLSNLSRLCTEVCSGPECFRNKVERDIVFVPVNVIKVNTA